MTSMQDALRACR